MGIRIHKVLGWGIEDICFEEYTCIDDRITPCFFDSTEYDHHTKALNSFLQFVKENQAECNQVIERVNGEQGRGQHLEISLLLMEDVSKKFGFYYNPEAEGNKRPIIFSPIDKTSDYRFNDTIDYYEADCIAKDKVKRLDEFCGIYPHLGMIHIPGSPRYNDKKYPPTISPYEYSFLMERWDEKYETTTDPDTIKYLTTYYRPRIPISIIIFAYWLKIFKDFYKTIHELRPMIYTFWC